MQMSMTLLPPAEGTCPVCGREHPDELPHDASTMYYQHRFYGLRGRWPTWSDAMAHCSIEIQSAWREGLEAQGMWVEPPEGFEPIADPPSESVRQLIDMNAHKE